MALRLTLHFDLANFPTRRCRCSRNRPPTPRQPGPLGPSTPPTLSQPRTISWSATGRPPSAHSYPLLRRLPRAASLARLGRQSAPAHCSGWRGRLLLRRPCWSVSVGAYRPCPAARQHRPRGQSGDAVAAKAAMGTGRRVVQLRLLGRQLSRAVHVRPSLVSWCDASFVRAYTLLPSWNGHAKRRGDGPRQAWPERQRNAH